VTWPDVLGAFLLNFSAIMSAVSKGNQDKKQAF
jgi:hypothetical protein